MLTAESVRHEINELITHNASRFKEDIERKRAERRINALSPILALLESSPNAEYLQAEIERGDALLRKIDGGYQAWCAHNKNDFLESDNPRTKYEKLMGVADIRRHVKNARIILNG